MATSNASGSAALLVDYYNGLDFILNKTMRAAFSELIFQEINQVYLLSNSDIGLDEVSFVDGTHPTDLGMLKYAEAYEKIIREILR